MMKKYPRKLYRYNIGKELNLDSLGSFNEKLQWLKLYDHSSQYMK